MPIKYRLADANLSQKLAQSELARFMEAEIVRVLGCDAKKCNLHIHWLAKSDCVTFSFRDQNDRIIPETPEFNPNLRWDWQPLLNWTAKDLAALPNAMEPFYAFLDAVRSGVRQEPLQESC